MHETGGDYCDNFECHSEDGGDHLCHTAGLTVIKSRSNYITRRLSTSMEARCMKTRNKQTTVLFLSLASLLWLFASAHPARAGTTNVLHWAFTSTSGSVTVPIADTSGAGNNGTTLLWTGPLVYSSDIPTNTQFCSGIGSVDFTGVSAAISTANSAGVGSGQGIVSAAQVYAAGGLTMEVWVKNPSLAAGSISPALALNMGGMYVLGVDASGNVGFFLGDNGGILDWTTTVTPDAWMHLAVVMANPDPTAQTYTNISSYVNGTLVNSSSHTFPWFLTRATSVGNHQYANWDDYEGLIYEPRITLGILTPDKFTVKPPPVYTTVTANPTNVLVKAGSTATFYVSATVSGAPPSSLTYQWQANGLDILNATNASYTTPATTVGDNLTAYRCGVSAPGMASPNYSQSATLYVYGQQGTLLDYGFAFTSGSVTANGGMVTNNAHPGMHNGLILTGDGGTYGTDIPPANRLTNTVGVGSLDLSSGALSTDPTGPTSGAGILDFSDIAGNGGLTLQTWVKGGSGSGLILNVADTYNLSATANGVQFAVDAASSGANVDMTQWHHVAGVIRNATLSGGALHGDVSLYVDGILQGTVTNATTSNDRQRATTVGDHSLVNSLGISAPFTGLVYEPVITLGALVPSQFTAQPLPVVITITNQPQSVYGLPGTTAALKVGATVSGASLTDIRYQWQQDGTNNIVGATSASYTTPTLVAGASDTYRCLVTVVGSTATALSSLATVEVANHAGTIVQYGFDFINNSVAVNGTVTNDAIAALFDGQVLTGDGGTYTNDLPPANLLQHTTGIGSLDLASGSITTDPTGATSGEGILSWADILANGGLTLETWVKGPYGTNTSQAIMTVAGEYALLAEPGSNGPVQFINGFKGGTDLVQAGVNPLQWHHIAGGTQQPNEAGLRSHRQSELVCGWHFAGHLYEFGLLDARPPARF